MKKSLLIVDDDVNLLNFISDYLRAEGFIIRTALTVDSALLLIKNTKPDMVLADIMMPELDGYNLLKILRTDILFASIPVIFISAKGMTSDRIYGYNLGCNAYIVKPFNPEELVSIINNIFANIEKVLMNKKKWVTHVNSTLDISIFNNKEKAVLGLIVKGLMNKEIAQRLHLSVRNVEKYVSRLLNKTQTRNRTELTQFALLNNFDIL